MFDRSSIRGTRKGAAAARTAPGRRRGEEPMAAGDGGEGQRAESPSSATTGRPSPPPGPVPVVLPAGRDGRTRTAGEGEGRTTRPRPGLGPWRKTAASPSPGPGGSEETGRDGSEGRGTGTACEERAAERAVPPGRASVPSVTGGGGPTPDRPHPAQEAPTRRDSRRGRVSEGEP
ncbi:hypothetical protein THAOC_21761 [Thalassiosira oceanica]|uniref:Uncharacterized protein n=1 Tax=Thalassiosira oceanica TaxID=159749 RepID=K0S0B8_THAOC|nr:hypothetical protein THAOC_21761 [Thalassiosira oceanica]|eukprot:EJK58139.1 hypothetical protein THAOC_21761 [Thalassiosira oceanica]